MVQAAQSAGCNATHNFEQRLARWLLITADRANTTQFKMSQEFLAHMLGTRRASVTVAAGILQRAGLIRYTRGEVNVVDRAGLEDACCECYRLMVNQSRNWEKESKD